MPGSTTYQSYGPRPVLQSSSPPATYYAAAPAASQYYYTSDEASYIPQLDSKIHEGLLHYNPVSETVHQISEYHLMMGGHDTQLPGYAGDQGTPQSTSGSPRAPLPFPRTSRTGARHFVTPARATPGFRCSFISDNGESCNSQAFNLPSEIRQHILDNHLRFSPFQCSNCKRVFTRLSLQTRHLRPDPDNPSGPRHCPNSPVVPDDDHYRIRCDVRAALWEIHTEQAEVDRAVELVKRYNGRLEERRRRVPASRQSADPEPHAALSPPQQPMPQPPQDVYPTMPAMMAHAPLPAYGPYPTPPQEPHWGHPHQAYSSPPYQPAPVASQGAMQGVEYTVASRAVDDMRYPQPQIPPLPPGNYDARQGWQ